MSPDEGMDMDGRQALAERATEIFNEADATTYSEAIDRAMAEANPTADPAGAQKLFQALLNVSLAEPPVFKRHENATDPRDALLGQ